MKKLEAKAVRESIMKELRLELDDMKKKGYRPPSLAIILIGDNPASLSYIRTKEKLATELGIVTTNYKISSDKNDEYVEDLIRQLNNDDTVDGIMLQLPVPPNFNSSKLIELIDPSKDADGLTTFSMGALLKEEATVSACTPLGIMELLKYYEIPLEGKNVLIINRSLIVGKPLALDMMARDANATVTVAHSKTKDLFSFVKNADIIVSAFAKPESIDKTWPIKNDAVVVDVSINRVEDKTSPKGYRVCGDFKPSDFEGSDIAYSPVPGGVGIMTVTMLIKNTMTLYKKHLGM